LQAINTTWGEAKRKAQDRTKWIETVYGFLEYIVDLWKIKYLLVQ
jgi:hypothetical protein